MIRLEKISFSYSDKKVIDELSCEFESGKITSVLGVNGSGKTTMLRLASGLNVCKSGRITIDDKDIKDYSKRELARKISVLPQSRQVPRISCYEFVEHGRFPYLGFSRKLSQNDIDIVNRAVRESGIEGIKNKMLNEISGGEQQKTYIAMIIAQDTPYVLLDEPTTYLDISHRLEIMKFMKNMRDNGKGVIAIMHDVSLALKYSDKVIILENGNIAFSGSSEDAVKSGSVERVFNVKCYPVEADGQTDYIFR